MNRSSASLSMLSVLFIASGAAAQASPPAEAPSAPSPDLPDSRAWRVASLRLGSTLAGSSGLMRVSEAGAGATGTFRISLAASDFSGSRVLCSKSRECPALSGEDRGASDDLSRISMQLGLSATLLPFLEAYGSLHNFATSDSRGRPPILQALGDSTLGVKLFTPMAPNTAFFFGGASELLLLNGSGGVGLNGKSTSFALRALGTADLDNRVNPGERIPLRFHVNLAYLFDNSAHAVSGVESAPPPAGRGQSISRVERFSLGINRVDFLQLGVGAELVHEYVRPFVEWTIDLPANRQGYTCHSELAAVNGDACLASNQNFQTTPSRLTLGARAFPWSEHGLALLAALDIGTGATSSFVDEISPELPWNFWLGVGYGFDTVPPEPRLVRVAAPPAPPPPPAAPPPEYFASGIVLEKGTGSPIPGATLLFDGRDVTGMVSRADGTFKSSPLEPGVYTFNVSAKGYHDGKCSATIVKSDGAPAKSSDGAVPAGDKPPTSEPSKDSSSDPSSARCELDALPKVGTVMGSLADAESNAAVAGGQIKITDKLGRALDLSADTAGAFRFENVPPGPIKLTVDVPGYFTSISEVNVQPNEEVQARVLLNKRPAQPNVVVAGHEIKLKKQVHFQTDSAQILPDSEGILEEFAEVMKGHPELRVVEVQGHTDNTGNEAYNLRLSQERAEAVVDAIVRLGVDASRMTPKGYGPSKPLVPNSSDANRAKNRRVQVLITEQGK